ncbi:hypothetical protein BC830DRAFT_1081821 [Chytriomyces sp. MP71]|nr:hypothetical protein BC830DRAFT_1081821 [Chytriomyces sp. MP71]
MTLRSGSRRGAGESDKILKQEDHHFKSLKAAKDFDKEHALNVRELLGFMDGTKGSKLWIIMGHPLMREAPMLYNAFKVINQLFENLDESGLTFHHQIAKILGLVINLKNSGKINSWQRIQAIVAQIKKEGSSKEGDSTMDKALDAINLVIMLTVLNSEVKESGWDVQKAATAKQQKQVEEYVA